MEELIQIVATYGLGGLFAVLFWKFITEVQQSQTETMQDMQGQLTRIEDLLQVEEMRRQRERRERDDDE